MAFKVIDVRRFLVLIVRNWDESTLRFLKFKETPSSFYAVFIE